MSVSGKSVTFHIGLFLSLFQHQCTNTSKNLVHITHYSFTQIIHNLHKEFWITIFITTVLTVFHHLPLLFMPMLFVPFRFMSLMWPMVSRVFHLWWAWRYNSQLWYSLRNFLYLTEKINLLHTHTHSHTFLSWPNRGKG